MRSWARGRRGGVLAAGAGAPEGRPGRHHAAERDGLSGDPVRGPDGRLHRRQRQPALHAARAHPSAQDSGARVLFVLENFGYTVEEALPDLTLDAVVLVTPGDLLGLKGAIVNLVSRHVKKAVKPFQLPRPIAVPRVPRRGREAPLKPVAVALEDVAFLQYTGGTTGVAKGATCSIATSPPTCAGARPGCARSSASAADHVMVTALPLYHIFALTVCALLMTRLGACQLLIANPRDIPGFVKTPEDAALHAHVGREHALQRARQPPGIEKVDFSEVVCASSGGMATRRRREEWKRADRLPHRRGLRPLGDLAGGLRQPLDIEEFSGTIGYPCPRPTCRSAAPTARPAARRARRALREGPAGHGGLLEAARRDREGDDPGRLFPHRRRGRRCCPTGRSRSSTG